MKSILFLGLRGLDVPALSSALNVLTQLPNLRRLRIKGAGLSVAIRAGDINNLTNLEVLALYNVRVEGDLHGPSLKEILCLADGVQLLTAGVLSNPPAVLKSVTVIEISPYGLLGDAVLGVTVPSKKGAVRTCVAGHWWSTTCEKHGWKRWFRQSFEKSTLVKIVR